MSEYPKVIWVDGLPITATDAADEARWREKPAAPINHREPEPEPEPEPAAPVEDAPPVPVPVKKKRVGKKR